MKSDYVDLIAWWSGDTKEFFVLSHPKIEFLSKSALLSYCPWGQIDRKMLYSLFELNADGTSWERAASQEVQSDPSA